MKRPPLKVYRVVDSDGWFYTGDLLRGKPYFSSNQEAAIELDEEDLALDFPDGLPEGCEKVLL